MAPKPKNNTPPPVASELGVLQKSIESAVTALISAKEALEALATARRGQKLSDTRARNVAREIHEQIKVIKAYQA